MTPVVFNVTTLAERWGCSKDTVRSLIRSGDLPSFKLGGKLDRIRADEVEKYECRNTPSNDTETASPSSGTRVGDATDIRLERLIDHQPRPQHARSGSGGR